MAVKTVPWTIEDHIKTQERQLGYLEAAFEDGDPSLIAAALGDIAKARGIVAVAEETGISRMGLYKALSPTGDPRLSTLLKVMASLGLKLEVKSRQSEDV